jgi:peroxiredoxin Q/BCP
MTTLAPGDKAPDFTLVSDDGPTLTLSDLRGQKVVLYAYPKAGTPGCSMQANDFRDADPAFAAAGYTIVGISPDSPEALAKFAEALKVEFALVSDPDHKVLEAYGAWGEKETFGRKSIGVIRSTFVIDPEGTLDLVEYSVKAPGHVGRLAAELGVDWP